MTDTTTSAGTTIWASGDPRRQDRATALRAAATVAGARQTNGIIAVEVVDAPAPAPAGAVDIVAELVFDAATAAPGRIRAADVVITGGVRRPTMTVASITQTGRFVRMRIARRGDFSRYTLSIERSGAPLPDFDPILSRVAMGFRLQCDQPFDCNAPDPVNEPPDDQATVNYLARDYTGFRRLMLDRFAELTPGWTYPGPASPEVTLIEMLAFAADRISYAQDAVATEAYLDTARLRVSAKRHARLVDYRMSDGTNARAFVHVRMRDPGAGGTVPTASIAAGARFLTRTNGLPAAGPDATRAAAARVAGAQLFEALTPCTARATHNRIVIHDYLGGLALIPRGATGITVADPGRMLALAVGDLVLIEEVLDNSGNASPDPTRRHIARLVGIIPDVDPVGARNGAGDPVALEILHLAWDGADALPFDLPLARVTATDAIDGLPVGTEQLSAVVRGNMLLVDHGESAGFDEIVPVRAAGRRRVTMPLSHGPVVIAPRPPRLVAVATPPLSPDTAYAMINPGDPERVPAVSARRDVGAGGDPVWTVRDTLLDADAATRALALDIDDSGRATLRSGDGVSGRIPEPGTPFTFRYRIGGGAIGNVGAETICHLLTDSYVGRDGALVVGFGGQAPDIVLVRNPMPAVGGTQPDDIASARLRAPIGFRTPDRAVVPRDYEAFLRQDPLVANIRAIEQWTGGERAIVLLVDLVGGAVLDDALERSFRRRLDRARLAGHVLEFRTPVLVPVDLAMRVCVIPTALRDVVLERLMAVFSASRFADGTTGLFHPDRFGFGDPLRLSTLYAAAQGVDGVRHVDITRLARQAEPGGGGGGGGGNGIGGALDSGHLDFGPYEIAMLANDPNFPDRGVVRFTMEGGR